MRKKLTAFVAGWVEVSTRGFDLNHGNWRQNLRTLAAMGSLFATIITLVGVAVGVQLALDWLSEKQQAFTVGVMATLSVLFALQVTKLMIRMSFVRSAGRRPILANKPARMGRSAAQIERNPSPIPAHSH